MPDGEMRPGMSGLALGLGIGRWDRAASRDFVQGALTRLREDAAAQVETPLVRVSLRQAPGVAILFKDESAHPSGSLKHRLVRSLFLHGLCNGTIGAETPLVDASSGSTAVSEAWFAQALGLPFHAVVPETTAAAKVARIEALGGTCHRVPGAEIVRVAEALAIRIGGLFLDQFTFAERVTDWRQGNVASAILEQMAARSDLSASAPDWFVVGAGTGGTATTIGRHLRHRGVPSRLCVVDPEHSAFFDGYVGGGRDAACARGSRIEGVGRPRVEASFMGQLIDRMVKVPDAASIAGMRIAGQVLGRKVGPSTGLNFVGAALLAVEMAAAGQRGSVATLICDDGDRYAGCCYDAGWLARQGLDVETAERVLRGALL